jgi:hypothetical protein
MTTTERPIPTPPLRVFAAYALRTATRVVTPDHVRHAAAVIGKALLFLYVFGVLTEPFGSAALLITGVLAAIWRLVRITGVASRVRRDMARWAGRES